MSYADEGFARLEVNALPRTLSECVAEFERCISGQESMGLQLDEQPFEGAEVRKVADTARRSELVCEIARTVGPAVLRETGWPNAILWMDAMYYKPPRSSKESAVPFHRDMQYWNGLVDPGDAATVIVPLYHARRESGGMGFVPGSHLLAEMPTEWHAWYPDMRPGEATLHHSLTMHGSLPNETDEPRRSISLHFRHPKVFVTREPR